MRSVENGLEVAVLEHQHPGKFLFFSIFSHFIFQFYKITKVRKYEKDIFWLLQITYSRTRARGRRRYSVLKVNADDPA